VGGISAFDTKSSWAHARSRGRNELANLHGGRGFRDQSVEAAEMPDV
jgi:hypothetical protein